MNTSKRTLLVDYYIKTIGTYDPSKPGPSLAKVKAAALSLTALKQTAIASLIGTKYDVLKAQRYRQDYKRLEDSHKRSFAASFVDKLITYTKKYSAGAGIAHGPELYIFSDITIYSDDLLDAIFERIATSGEISKILEASDTLRSVFLNDVLLLLMNIRKGNIRVDKDGTWNIANPTIVKQAGPSLTVLTLEGQFQGNNVSLAFWLANLIRKSWNADPEIVKQDLEAFLKEITA